MVYLILKKSMKLFELMAYFTSLSYFASLWPLWHVTSSTHSPRFMRRRHRSSFQSWGPDIIFRRLRHAITIPSKYFTKWNLRLNAHKTEPIPFSKRRSLLPDPLTLGLICKVYKSSSRLKYPTPSIHSLSPIKPQKFSVTSSLSSSDIQRSHSPAS
jgi:hypothetical protein